MKPTKGRQVPELGEQIRALLEQSGLSNYFVAQELGVPESTVWRFRKGGDMKVSTAGRLCVLLNIEPLKVGRSARKTAPAERAPVDRSDGSEL